MSRNSLNFNTVLLVLTLAVFAVICVLLFGVWQATQGLQRAANLPGETVDELKTRIAVLQNPTPTIRPSPATIVIQIQTLSRLETAAYTVEKVITAEENQGPFGWLFGDKLLFVAHGQVIAGVDLSRMQSSDIVVTDDNRVIVTLPAAEVLVATLDNEKSYVYSRETGILAGDIHLETAARQAAESEIRAAALEDGILTLAQQNAENVVRSLLISLGFREVQFITATPVPRATVRPSPTP
jgi:hypothetical protein